ncbi:MAG: hypothetical protein H7331_05300 [Bacteroidia bacterium]|nr:hypothetical protein [Bacteroidia bacterium]
MIRTIITPNTQTVFFDVPKEYVGKELEIIAFTKNDYLNTTTHQKQVSFSALSIDTKGFKFDRDEANDR